jgi:uncharacterized protein
MTGSSDAVLASLATGAPGLVALGLLVGGMTGLFGVGGGFLVTPMLHAAFGLPYTLAVGTSLCFTLGAATTGAARHARVGNLDAKSALIIGGGAVSGSWLGVGLHGHLERTLHGGAGLSFDGLMDILFIVLLAATAALFLLRPSAVGRGRSPLQMLDVRPFVNLPGLHLPRVSLVGLVLVGIAIGAMGGLLGIGGGVFVVPLLTLVVGMPIHKAVGTSLGIVFCSAAVSAAQFAAKGEVDLVSAMWLLAGSAAGIQAGTTLCRRLSPRLLTRLFVVVVALAIVLLAWRTMQG